MGITLWRVVTILGADDGSVVKLDKNSMLCWNWLWIDHKPNQMTKGKLASLITNPRRPHRAAGNTLLPRPSQPCIFLIPGYGLEPECRCNNLWKFPKVKVNECCRNRVTARDKEVQITYHLLTDKLLQNPFNRSFVPATPRGRLHLVHFGSSKIYIWFV